MSEGFLYIADDRFVIRRAKTYFWHSVAFRKNFIAKRTSICNFGRKVVLARSAHGIGAFKIFYNPNCVGTLRLEQNNKNNAENEGRSRRNFNNQRQFRFITIFYATRTKNHERMSTQDLLLMIESAVSDGETDFDISASLIQMIFLF